MASLTQWTWIWVHSGSWWRTGWPGLLPFMGLQRVRQDWATELNWSEQMPRSKDRQNSRKQNDNSNRKTKSSLSSQRTRKGTAEPDTKSLDGTCFIPGKQNRTLCGSIPGTAVNSEQMPTRAPHQAATRCPSCSLGDQRRLIGNRNHRPD